MVATFRVSDTIRCIAINAPVTANLAAPTEIIVRNRPLRNLTLWAQSLGSHTSRVTVGNWNGIKLGSLASVRVRSGIRSWEVDRLHLNDNSQALETLEEAVHSAGSRGAERVFLRVPYESGLLKIAQKAGFFPYFNEVHLAGRRAQSNTHVNGFSTEYKTSSDLQGLFQLYCSVTPQKIREGTGMTIDQWKDSQEPAYAHRDESVLKLDGMIVGWWSCDFFSKATFKQTLNHPEHLHSTLYLINISNRTENWLVPDYQPQVENLLRRKGLKECGRYTMLIRTITVPITSREFSYVEA